MQELPVALAIVECIIDYHAYSLYEKPQGNTRSSFNGGKGQSSKSSKGKSGGADYKKGRPNSLSSASS